MASSVTKEAEGGVSIGGVDEGAQIRLSKIFYD